MKPANILLTEYGEPQLTDFGIARIAGGFETSAGFIAGTPAFTAPEVLSGAAPTVASDLYGLGATLFCALTGHAAFERQSGESVVAQFLRISSQPVPDLRKVDIPDALSRAVERAMARDPAERPTSAGEFGEELCDIGRRIGFGVDEMALRVDPGRGLVAGGNGSAYRWNWSTYLRRSSDGAADPGYQVSSTASSPGAGPSAPVDRCATRGRTAATDRDSRAGRIRKDDARRAVAGGTGA